MEMVPTRARERYEFLDVLRGAALFGIVSANMIGYSLYLYLPDSAKAGMTTYAADKVLDILELMLIEGKFYTIFSVLFGVGFSILLSRSRAKDLLFHRFFLRRVFFSTCLASLTLSFSGTTIFLSSTPFVVRCYCLLSQSGIGRSLQSPHSYYWRPSRSSWWVEYRLTFSPRRRWHYLTGLD